MPKFTEPEKDFWEIMFKYANKKGSKLYCNICHRKIRSGTKEAHDHFFGKSHPNNNIYEIFSPVPLESRTLLRIDGEQRLIG